MTSPDWLQIQRGSAPLIVSIPHAGTELPSELTDRLVSPWLARKDADWWIDQLYDFASSMGATTIGTALSRTAVDVNRDPSGVSLYPGQATTELCPTTTFDGEPLYKAGRELRPDEVTGRREKWFDPYHAALDAEVARLRLQHAKIVVYDCHSIRSVIPRLFDGVLPVFNIGTNDGVTCASTLSETIADLCSNTGRSSVLNGRFRGGFITRRLGNPAAGVHAVQMESACRGYMREPQGEVSETEWPSPFDASYAAAIRETLVCVLAACLAFARDA